MEGNRRRGFYNIKDQIDALRDQDIRTITFDGNVSGHRLIEVDGSGDHVVATVDSETVVGAEWDNESVTSGDKGRIKEIGRVKVEAADVVEAGKDLKSYTAGKVGLAITAALAGSALGALTNKTGFLNAKYTHANQPADDNVEVKSSSAADTMNCTVWGTLQGGTDLYYQTLPLNGTTFVVFEADAAAGQKALKYEDDTVAAANWDVIYAVTLASLPAGTISMEETSGSLLILDTVAAAVAYGYHEATDDRAYNGIPTATNSAAGTEKIIIAGYGTDEAKKAEVITLNGTTPVNASVAYSKIDFICNGPLGEASDLNVDIKVAAEEDENHIVGKSLTAAAAAGTDVDLRLR